MWASDSKYQYLYAFKSWVSTHLSFPVPEVGVRVEVIDGGATELSGGTCSGCTRILEESELVDTAVAVAWREIDTCSLKSIVSYIFHFDRQ